VLLLSYFHLLYLIQSKKVRWMPIMISLLSHTTLSFCYLFPHSSSFPHPAYPLLTSIHKHSFYSLSIYLSLSLAALSRTQSSQTAHTTQQTQSIPSISLFLSPSTPKLPEQHTLSLSFPPSLDLFLLLSLSLSLPLSLCHSFSLPHSHLLLSFISSYS
jgi:hypothetical protein